MSELTKDQVSDLKSLIDRSEKCAVDLRNAQIDKASADRNLENWLHLHSRAINQDKK